MKHQIQIQGGIIGAALLPSKEGDNTPLIYINGGPGGTYLDEDASIGGLSLKRDVVLYDQLGSYHSPATFDIAHTPMERFVSELEAVRAHFGFEEVILLGHSFGGTIALDYALAHPKHVAGLILSSPLISTPRWIEDANHLLGEIPEKERRIIRHALAGEAVDSEAYDAAERVFYNRHLCRLNPWPARLLESFTKGNKEIYNAMWGRSEFTCTGTLKAYDRFLDLHHLKMPVLLTCGRYDEARPQTMAEAAEKITDAQLVVFEESSHTPIYEEKELYLSVMNNFCAQVDARGT